MPSSSMCRRCSDRWESSVESARRRPQGAHLPASPRVTRTWYRSVTVPVTRKPSAPLTTCTSDAPSTWGVPPRAGSHRSSVPVPPAYKEQAPTKPVQGAQWKSAKPDDTAICGKWWEIFNDPKLNTLEEQVNISNQNVLTAEAQFRAARDSVRIARSGLIPTATTNRSFSNS